MSGTNLVTHGLLGLIFLKTALPIIFVMGMNGLLTVVDAIFLGRCVGPEALGAVTLIFPLFMLIVALATLVSNGMSSILASNLGAGDLRAAGTTYAGAHGLALCVSGLLILGYLLIGRPLTLAPASGSVPLAGMAQTYLMITSFAAPIAFVLAVNSDAQTIGVLAATSGARGPCPARQTVYIGHSLAKHMNRAVSRGGVARVNRPAFEMRLDKSRSTHATL
ncbi:MAG: hypothetical protein HKN30_01650 [Sulfitobacter sp.]|nr:hypothetical protein [Sulfitobacter sp.]